METKTKSKNLLIGSMLFGLFFGAGNLIFPVHLGQEAGGNALLATLGFLITGTGFPFLGVIAMGITGNKTVIEFGSRVHRVYGYVVSILLYLTIGPLFALPRTATVSFEVGFNPIISDKYQGLALAIFTVMFFLVVLFFSLRPNRILDWVGKILNPIFLVFIGLLIILALTNPMGSVSGAAAVGGYVSASFSKGFIEGYQTMDALAALAFGGLVITSVESFGTTSGKETALGTMRSGLVSVVLMCLIYGGLAWLGATSTAYFPVSANGGIALAQISRHYLGSFGSLFLAITITIACLKTAIGLITCCSQAFMDMFPHSFSYRIYAFFFTGFSCVVANIGLNRIIEFAVPMLMFLYPLAMTLILLNLFGGLFNHRREIYVSVTIGATIVAVGDMLYALPDVVKDKGVISGVITLYQKYIPLFDISLGWIFPALAGLIVGIAIVLLRPKAKA